MSSKSTKSARVRLYKEQNGCCYYCGRKMKLFGHSSNKKRATIDHVLPKCHGGRNTVSNYVVACRRCNMRRDAVDNVLFKTTLEQYGWDAIFELKRKFKEGREYRTLLKELGSCVYV